MDAGDVWYVIENSSCSNLNILCTAVNWNADLLCLFPSQKKLSDYVEIRHTYRAYIWTSSGNQE